MEPRSSSIKLKLLSGKDLRTFNFFQKLCVYAVVSIVDDDPSKRIEIRHERRTPSDEDGDGNPEWNHEMEFDLDHDSFSDSDRLFLKFDLRNEGVLFGDKPIGEVRVTLRDLIEQKPYGIVRFVSYQVRSSDGKPNGVLNFSYQVIRKAEFLEASSETNHITGFPLLYPPLSEPYTSVTTHVHHSAPESPSLYPEIDLNPSPPPYYIPPPETHFQPRMPVYPPPPQPPAGPPHVAHGEFYPPHLYPWNRGPYEHNAYGYSAPSNQGFITGHEHHRYASDGRTD